MDGVFIAKAAAFFGAAFAMGVGAISPAYGQGLVGAKACENIGKYPESARDIRTTMFLAMGMIETSAIYALLVAGGCIWGLSTSKRKVNRNDPQWDYYCSDY